MKSNLVGKIFGIPTIPISFCFEKLGDYFTNRSIMLESCEGHLGQYKDFTSLNEADMVLSEIAGMTFDYLAHPFGGKRITKSKVYDHSWFR